jgi:hypothetical protein
MRRIFLVKFDNETTAMISATSWAEAAHKALELADTAHIYVHSITEVV